MNATEWKLGLSASSFGSLDRAVFEGYASANIQVMELSLPSELYDTIPWQEVKRNASETGVEVRSIHLPFYPFAIRDLASLDEQVRKGTVAAHKELISRAGEIGTHIATVHPSVAPLAAEQRGEHMKRAKESLAELAEHAASCGSTLGVENLSSNEALGNCIEDMRALLAADDRLRLTFDVNHMLRHPHAEYIRALGDRFVNIHVSDYDFIAERHWLPYEGKIDWVELVTLLEEAGYEGPFLYEVPAKNAIRSRPLTFADYRENFEALVNKRPAPRI